MRLLGRYFQGLILLLCGVRELILLLELSKRDGRSVLESWFA